MKEGAARLESLDLFRGITLAGMLVVNNQGDWAHVVAPARHAPWHGCTPADLVFPFFLFIAGVSVTISLTAKISDSVPRSLLLRKILARSLIIFALGMIAHLPFDLEFSVMRFPGVLQRIALCYFFAAVLFLYLPRRALMLSFPAALAAYWLVLEFAPVPGIGAAMLDPYNNICRFVDSALFGAHTLKSAPAPGFDPEGIVSTLGALATTLAGTLTGLWLIKRDAPGRGPGAMFIAGLLALLAGSFMDLFMPVNKQLWTPSYAVFTAGWALAALALCRALADGRPRRPWQTPFVALGMNSLLVFFLSSVTAKLSIHVRVGDSALKAVLHETLFASWLPAEWASLGYSMMVMLFWTLAAVALYRKGLFVRI